MKWAYHQETVPLEQVAEVCQKAAGDGWRLHTALPVVVQAGSILRPQPTLGAFLLFERAGLLAEPKG